MGVTGDIKERWAQHKRLMHKHPHWPLYQAFHEHGIENFTIEQVEKVTNWTHFNEVMEREVHWMRHFNSAYPNGYNAERFALKRLRQ